MKLAYRHTNNISFLSPMRTISILIVMWFVIVRHCSVLGKEYLLNLDEPIILKMSEKNNQLKVSTIPRDISHLVIQVHTHFSKVVLSETVKPSYGSSVTGHNVGMEALLKWGISEKTWYLLLGDVRKTLKVLIVVTGYKKWDPVVGGCNLVFPLENDPNSNINFCNYTTSIFFQLSNVGFLRDMRPPSCEDSLTQNTLEYRVFMRYLPPASYDEDVYFRILKLMLSPKSIMKNGQQISTIHNTETSKTFVSVTSWTGQGVIFAVVVQQANGGEASYVPVVTYNCDIQHGRDNCDYSKNVTGKVLTALSVIVGLFLCFLGHRFLKTEMFIFGFLAMFLLSTILILRFTELYIGVVSAIAAVVGVAGGVIWLGVWLFIHSPRISVLIPGLVASFLFVSVLFSTPLGALEYWRNSVNYGLVFTSVTAVLPFILCAFSRPLNIISCTFVGSYFVVLLPDYYLYGSLNYFLMSSIYKGAYSKYLKAIVIFPYGRSEIALTVCWLLLLIMATIFQYFRERNQPPFPPKSSSRFSSQPSIPFTQPVDERTPLIYAVPVTPSAPPLPSYT